MPNGFRVFSVFSDFNALTALRFLQATAAVCFSLQALALSPPPPIASGKFGPPPDWRPPVIALNNASGQPIALRAASVEVDLFGDRA